MQGSTLRLGDPCHDCKGGDPVRYEDKCRLPEVSIVHDHIYKDRGDVYRIWNICQPALPAIWQVAAANFDEPFVLLVLIHTAILTKKNSNTSSSE